MTNLLYDKVLGLAGSNIGSAMGARWRWPRKGSQRRYGVLTELLPYAHYTHYDKPGAGRLRPAGTTEDGIERQRLMCTAIIEKGGRITAADLAAIWVRDINPANFGVQMEPCDEVLYRAVMAGIPPTDAGRYTNFLGINSFARSGHPIGLINACDVPQAIADTYEIGQLYQARHGYGLDYGAAVNAGIAEAMKPMPRWIPWFSGIRCFAGGDTNQQPKWSWPGH